MAELALGILGPAIEMVRWVAAPVKRQLSYLCCFTSNVAALKGEAKNLDYEAGKLQDRVTQDKNDGREDIHEIVQTWLADSGYITRKMERILAEATEAGLGSGCSNYAKRVSLSKEAKKTAEAMKEHIQKCKFDSISRAPRIAATSAVTFGKVIYEFSSRKRFEEDIITSLDRSKNVDKVGVWGIGGVGKTIMAKKIMNRAREEGLFDEVVMVTVSQPVDKFAIQKNIAEKLGLTLKEENLDTRADRLRARLMQKNRTLLLLDDVWDALHVEELGIPCDGERCTIILTTRNKDVLKGMKVEKVCELGVLDEDEAWDFFKKMAGTCVDDAILKPTAYKVMQECKGLLVALETVGKAHEDEKRRDIWIDSLEQLRRHNPRDIPNVIEEVYRPLKLSYDRLDRYQNAQSVFLLCCLFAEDANIPLDQLACFALGLRLFDDIWELGEVRGRIRRSVDTLRNRCLLLDGCNEDHVRMHDVVRDVSIFIAEEKRMVKCNDCTWISSHLDGGTTHDPRVQSRFSKLKLLWMENKYGEQEMGINLGNLIGGSTELNVLFIDKYSLMKSLPALKTSLTTLVLYNCSSLESIDVFAALPLLEYLSLNDIPNLEEIWGDAPIPSNSSKNLKYLKLSKLPNLKRMGKTELSTAKDFCLQLEKLIIFDCDEMEELVLVPREEEQDHGNHISTVLIFPKLKALHLSGLPKLRSMINNSRGIESIQFPLLAEMEISLGDNLKWISNDHDHHDDDSSHLFCRSKVSFPNLKGLSLLSNVKCKNVWCDEVPMGFFRGLVELRIVDYKKIRRLFSSSSKIPHNLVNLQKLEISYCDEMVKMIEDDDEEIVSSSSSSSCHHPTNPTTSTPLFPSLQHLGLWSLPKLESFCEWRRRVDLELPSLKKLEINHCPKMKSFNAGAGSLVITPALQTVEINYKDFECGDDLNAAVHRQFEKAKVQDPSSSHPLSKLLK